ncbi:MAG TPA: hypothetical protein PLD25_30945 [Chloroflexota bacterium]|nr:hypothetical protein [Chloroflexota bacterium]HUM67591.1 hypothetical protein [Chloroflexota bacterium]
MMNEFEPKAIEFSEEVDALLVGKQLDRREDQSHANDLVLLASRLHTLEFPASKQSQRQLRHQLWQQIEAKQESHTRRWSLAHPLIPGRRLILRAAIAIILLLGLLFTLPAGRSVLASVQEFLRELRWENTSAVQVAPESEPENLDELKARFEREEAEGRAWSYSFEGHNFGGCCADGVRNEIVSLEQALTEAGYPLMLPGYVPDGYPLAEIRLMGLPPYGVFVIYEGPAGRVGLYQSRGGNIAQNEVDEYTVEVDARASAIVTEGSMEDVLVGDITAALINGTSVVWEENGVSLHLIGPGLDTATLLQIAESLEPSN